jgi:hypothetical protein
VAKIAKGLKGMVLRIYFFAHKILVFHLFSLFCFANDFALCHLQCNCYDLNVKFLIFLKKFYKVHNVEVLCHDPIKKNNSSSFIITNMELSSSHVCQT